MGEREVAVLELLGVAHQLRFSVMRVEDRMREELALALCDRWDRRGGPVGAGGNSLLADSFGQPGEHIVHILGAHGLVEADRYAVLQVTGIDHAGLKGLSDHIACSAFQRHRVEVTVVLHGITEGLRAVGQLLGEAMHALRNALQSTRPVVHRVHAGHHRQQRLCRADVRGGLVAADVLLACLQSHAQCTLPAAVLAHADDAAGDQSFPIVGAREEGGVRATVAHRNTETLAVAHADVGAPFARRREQGQCEQIAAYRDFHTGSFRFRHYFAQIVHTAIDRRILHDHAEERSVRRPARHVAFHQFDAHRGRARLQHVDVLREEAFVDEELVVAHLAMRPCMIEHQHRLRGGRRFIQQRCVRDGQRRQIAHHRLEIQQRFQATLRDLRLVGRIGSVPTGVLQDVPHDRLGHDGAVVAQADVTAEALVARAERTHVLQVFQFRERIAHIQRLLQADGAGNGLLDQFIDRAHTDRLQHRLGVVGIRADVAFLVGREVHGSL